MSREVIKANSFNSVSAGGTATLELPTGSLTYHSIRLVYGTATVGGPTEVNMRAEINEIRLLVDGKVQRVFSAAELFDAINGVNGITVNGGATEGFLPIYFSEFWRRSVGGEEVLAWGTADIQTFTLEVDIDAGATTPTIRALLEVDRTRRDMGSIKKVRRFTIPVAAVGLHNHTSLPRFDAYMRLHAFSTDITDIEVVIDQEKVWELSDTEARDLFADKGFTDIPAVTSVMFDHTQRSADVEEMRLDLGNGRIKQRSQFQVDFTMALANPFVLLTESFGPRD